MLEWFAERVDRIILLFDAHKLDISDEFSEVIKALKNHEDKIRCWLVIMLLHMLTAESAPFSLFRSHVWLD